VYDLTFEHGMCTSLFDDFEMRKDVHKGETSERRGILIMNRFRRCWNSKHIFFLKSMSYQNISMCVCVCFRSNTSVSVSSRAPDRLKFL
jgi:hypothetical protein